MFCVKCGQAISDGSAFCAHCGASQVVYQAPVQPVQPQYQAPVEPVYAPPVQPQYQAPVEPVYASPVQPQYQAPVEPVYAPPVQPQYQAPVEPVYTPPVQATPNYGPKNLSWKDFYGQYVSKKVKSTVTWMVVICFFTAVLSIAITGIMEGALDPIYAVMDVAVYALSGVLLLSTKHWATVLLPTIYGAVWMVISMANDGTPSGFVAVIVGVTCISVLKKADKAYQTYKTTGIVPDEPI